MIVHIEGEFESDGASQAVNDEIILDIQLHYCIATGAFPC
jgi:hypothetical protein